MKEVVIGMALLEIHLQLTVTHIGERSIGLTWVDDSSVLGDYFYEIRRNGEKIVVLPASVKSFVDETVLPGTTYDYTVLAVITSPMSEMLVEKTNGLNLEEMGHFYANDYSVWQLQSPNFRHVADDRTRMELMERRFNDWWYYDEKWKMDAFVVPNVGLSTGNATSTRTELRELLPGFLNTSAYQANWRPVGYHRMEAIYVIDFLGSQPTSLFVMTNGATTIGQVWGTQSSMFELAVNNDGTFVVRPPQTGGSWCRLPDVRYQMGTRFHVTYEVNNGTLRLFINGVEVYTFTGMLQTSNTYYFKAGNYDKSTDVTGLTNREPYSKVLISQLSVEHNPVVGRLTLNGESLPNQVVLYQLTGGGLPVNFESEVKTDENGFYHIKNVPSQASDGTTAQVLIIPPAIESVGARTVNRSSLIIPSVHASTISGVRSIGNDFNYQT